MPSKPPEGCLTRPEAAKLFNRSRRALERDLDLAVSMQDTNVLDYWWLVTKDGEVRRAAEVATDYVKKLVAEGMTPTWYVEQNWLDQEYGRKGTSKSSRSRDEVNPLVQTTPELPHSEPSTNTVPAPSVQSALPTEIAFLKERIQTLEREKKEEIERSEKREAKLFEELAVKNKQISSWDEITQGLARGLATGQLVPSLLRTGSDAAPDSDAGDAHPQSVEDAMLVDQTPAKPKQTRKKSAAKSKRKSNRRRSKSVFEKHTPTFHTVASSLLHRS